MKSVLMLSGCIPELSRRHRLRAATRDSHERVDQLVEASGFLACRARYPSFLEGTWRARRALESALDENQAHRLFDQWPQSRIAALLHRDYRDVTGLDLDRLDPNPDAGSRLSDAEIFGILYVLEGSSLGARLIARAVSEIGFGPTWGARHLAQQNGRPKAWPSFLIHLEEYPMSEFDERRCVSAAMQAFELFENSYAKTSISQ